MTTLGSAALAGAASLASSFDAAALAGDTTGSAALAGATSAGCSSFFAPSSLAPSSLAPSFLAPSFLAPSFFAPSFSPSFSRELRELRERERLRESSFCRRRARCCLESSF